MRVKTGITRRRRHKKILKANKGYRMSKSKLYKVGHEAYMHAGQYSYNDRKKRRNQARKVWIDRMNAAARENGMTYSQLIHKLRTADIQLNRKMLSEIALGHSEVFSKIVASL
ncbi:50S ribosomal protein L20 [Candidatus Nomurabacteria bacterium]|uniref:Large ribosomal subunit protein bL20 n=1 Tax=Candidatus Dojkabacteria bacterium TaxID=2099670 RepID=A0A955I999_9BACT|nr:50S ribosomal protein L20 [Candidatus Dojkabacteria bacterium]MCB9789901.1 50S ribosomal protein L20 [Candidatus Nomurabacteria bacterium]MCB9803476.1 50S ribosomal protein L20 [Candidatus Nomurabacteria bacterium]